MGCRSPQTYVIETDHNVTAKSFRTRQAKALARTTVLALLIGPYRYARRDSVVAYVAVASCSSTLVGPTWRMRNAAFLLLQRLKSMHAHACCAV